jgi:hypothetical protein
MTISDKVYGWMGKNRNKPLTCILFNGAYTKQQQTTGSNLDSQRLLIKKV